VSRKKAGKTRVQPDHTLWGLEKELHGRNEGSERRVKPTLRKGEGLVGNQHDQKEHPNKGVADLKARRLKPQRGIAN